MGDRKKGLFSFGETATERRSSTLLFLIGLGSVTQINIGGYTAISELLLVLFLPINLMRNQALFRRDGLNSFIVLLFFWMAGVCFTDIYTHNYFAAWIRGMIPPVGILASLAAVYPLLRRSPLSYKWLLLGVAISGIISIFIFQQGAAAGQSVVLSGEMTAAEATMGYKLFWVGKLNEWLGLPIKGWYLSAPHVFSVGVAWFLAIFALLTGGRSAFAVGAVSALFIMLGGKTQQKLVLLKRHIPFVIIALLLLLPIVKLGYKYAATHGWMGEGEEEKYYEQAEGKNIVQTLMAGRSEFFVALFAIKDHPWIGHGSHALDTKGYRMDFCAKYGDAEDLKKMEEAYRDRIRTIPAHSHIICYWLWTGIPGLLPWLYILSILAGTLFKRMHVMPDYFGFFALILPTMFWHIFFSPFGSRINMGFLMAMCFLVKAIERDQKRQGGFVR